MQHLYSNLIHHFSTITRHRHEVLRLCFRVGIRRQGLLHDLSKYSPAEFITGVRYYQGDKSPNNAERLQKGASYAWMHHKGRNKHHYEYWNDYIPGAAPGTAGPVRMPRNYVAEMYCDRVAACKIYNGANYHPGQPLEYLNRSADHMLIHPDTLRELRLLLTLHAKYGEEKTCRYIRERYLKKV